MKIIRLNSNEALGREAASLILEQLDKNKNALLCAATGGSPTGTYSMLKQTYDHNPGLFSELRIIKLDEWGGVPMDTPFNCECYIQDHLTGPLQIGSDDAGDRHSVADERDRSDLRQ